MSDLPVRDDLVIPGAELVESTSRGGGPGGQHANKTSTRVTLRWSVRESTVLDERRRERLMRRLAPRLTGEGELVVHVDTHRSQHQNRQEARERLAGLVRDALRVRPTRRPTRPTRGSRERRIEAKKQAGQKKAGRSWKWKG